MQFDVFLVVIAAALAHAVWNAALKSQSDRLGILKVTAIVQIVASLAVMPFFPLPPLASLPYLLSSATIGVGSMLLLSKVYRLGDLSQIYPLSRGSAPLIVAVVSTTMLGVQLSTAGIAGILLIAVGITSLSLARGLGGLQNMNVVALAVFSGALTAACNMLDGYGARIAGNAHGYVALLAFVLSVLTLVAIRFLTRGSGAPLTARTAQVGTFVGVVSFGAAWAVIWAMTQAPIPLVSALRETSIVFAALIGVLMFREHLNGARIVSIGLVLAGTVVLRLA